MWHHRCVTPCLIRLQFVQEKVLHVPEGEFRDWMAANNLLMLQHIMEH